MTVRVCYPFVGDSVGGAQISALLLARNIPANVFEPVFVLHERGPLATLLESEGIEYSLLPVERFPGTLPGLCSIATGVATTIAPLRRFLIDQRIGIVHANDLRMNLSWIIPSRLAGCRFVWHQRTMPERGSRLWRIVPRVASKTIAISEAVAQAIGLPPANVVYNPFREVRRHGGREEMRRRLKEKLDLPQDDLVIGFVGRLVGYKRPDLCIEILSRLLKRLGRGVHAVFAGHGTETEIVSLKRLALDLGVSDRVHFLGFCPAVEEELMAMDCLLAPSETEGFGRVLVESYLVGTLVVASDIAAHREIVRLVGSGRLARPGDAESFTSEVLQSLSPSASVSQASARAGDICRELFSLDKHVARMVEVYDHSLHLSGAVALRAAR